MNNDAAATGIMAAFAGIYLIVWLAILAFSVYIQWRIFSKAGFNGALSLLMFVPCIGFVVIIWFAFTEWPIEQQLRAMGGGAVGGSPYYRPGQNYGQAPGPGYGPGYGPQQGPPPPGQEPPPPQV